MVVSLGITRGSRGLPARGSANGIKPAHRGCAPAGAAYGHACSGGFNRTGTGLRATRLDQPIGVRDTDAGAAIAFPPSPQGRHSTHGGIGAAVTVERLARSVATFVAGIWRSTGGGSSVLLGRYLCSNGVRCEVFDSDDVAGRLVDTFADHRAATMKSPIDEVRCGVCLSIYREGFRVRDEEVCAEQCGAWTSLPAVRVDGCFRGLR